jgi:hypothetical protein
MQKEEVATARLAGRGAQLRAAASMTLYNLGTGVSGARNRSVGRTAIGYDDFVGRPCLPL